MSSSDRNRPGWRTPAFVLACGSLILTLSLGIRHGFGLFLNPMSLEMGWGRESFAFALALQNLVWGVSQPVVGMFADRWGGGRTVGVGALLYGAGLVLMARADTPLSLALGAGCLIGLAQSFCTFSVVTGVVGRAVPAERRSVAFGIAGAAGSFGQFAMLPLAERLIAWLGWQGALLVLSSLTLVMLPLALGLVEKGGRVLAAGPVTSAREAFREAAGQRDFWLLCAGFFVCGFQVVFVAVHLPVYLLDAGLPARVGAAALALIGLFNIFGSYLAGVLGARLRKPLLLSGIYGLRALVIVAYLAVPLSALSTYLFAAALGFLWLSTVPLTNGTVASLFGVRHLSMLSGIVFLFHQIGSFLGAWLGGYVYDRTSSYNLVWGCAVALGIMAMLINLPIRERPVGRLAAA